MKKPLAVKRGVPSQYTGDIPEMQPVSPLKTKKPKGKKSSPLKMLPNMQNMTNRSGEYE